MLEKIPSYEEATGMIDYTFTNDYMFRAVLQSNEKVLRGLVGALLHLNATNKLMNVKSHKVFNDKFVLNVLSLKQTERQNRALLHSQQLITC